MKKLHTEAHTAYKDERGIVHIEIKDGAHLNEESVAKLRDMINQLAENKKMLVLVDARTHHTMTDKAMEHLKTGMLDKDRIATAILSEKLAVRLTVDYFNNVMKSKSEIKMFSAEQDAINWLLSFPKEN